MGLDCVSVAIKQFISVDSNYARHMKQLKEAPNNRKIVYSNLFIEICTLWQQQQQSQREQEQQYNNNNKKISRSKYAVLTLSIKQYYQILNTRNLTPLKSNVERSSTFSIYII